MKQRAKELDLQKRAQRAGGGSKYGTGISGNMYSSSSTDNKPDVTPTPVTYSTTTTFITYYNFPQSQQNSYFCANSKTLEIVKSLIDFILHIDKHLADIISQYHALTYLILFAIIFNII